MLLDLRSRAGSARGFPARRLRAIWRVDGQQSELTVERMCTVAALSRASYYRHLGPQPADDEERSRLHDAIERIALAQRHYGYRRITHALRAQGWEVNGKRGARLLRGTTCWLSVNAALRLLQLIANMIWRYRSTWRRLTPTAVNQLWVADITYIRFGRADVFLAVVLDAFSRKVIGWNVAASLAATLPLQALRDVIASHHPEPGLIYHSEPGVQYASAAYLDMLLEHGILPSRSRPGNPYDNVKCERFTKTLKQEEIRCSEYRDLDHLRANLSRFFEAYYHNGAAFRARLPIARSVRTGSSSIGDFEPAGRPEDEFSRHEEIYPSDVRP